MIEDIRVSRVEILIQQQKFAEAEKVLADMLSQDSNNVYYLYLLAEVNLQLDNNEKAENIIDSAIGLEPDAAHLFHLKARIAIQQDRLSDAELIITQAINLDPYDADYYALKANITLARKQFNEALDLANHALEIDPENILALNTRSTALNKLNRGEESFESIEGALRQDPNNAYTHANYGWGLLEKGDHKKALVHFNEALKNDPTFDYAQAGMLESIKASNPVYRLFLRYSFWMGNLTAKYQWAVIIGFYLAFRALRAIASSNESLQPYLIPLIVLLALFAFSTWVMAPISNLFLRFNKYGKLLLDKKEKMSSNFVAASFGLFVAGLLMYFLLSNEAFLAVAVFGFAMMLPFGVMFTPSKYKNSLLIYAVVMSMVGILAIAFAFSTGQLFNTFSVIFILGFVLFQWVANFLMIREDNQ